MIHQATEIKYGTLDKGDVLSVEHCEAVMGIDRKTNPSGYTLALMGLVAQVQREIAQEGKRYTVATRKGQVVVLTDPEAAEYQDHRFESGQKTSRRAHFYNQCVDVNNLDQDQRSKHDYNLIKQAAILSAAKGARQALHPIPVKRVTPTLG